jgi:hypothetical protein
MVAREGFLGTLVPRERGCILLEEWHRVTFNAVQRLRRLGGTLDRRNWARTRRRPAGVLSSRTQGGQKDWSQQGEKEPA